MHPLRAREERLELAGHLRTEAPQRQEALLPEGDHLQTLEGPRVLGVAQQLVGLLVQVERLLLEDHQPLVELPPARVG